MIVYMKSGATEEEINRVVERAEQSGNGYDVSRGDRVVIGIKGNTKKISEGHFAELSGVDGVYRISTRWKEVSREYHPEDSIVRVGSVEVGKDLVIIAGPCAVESKEQMIDAAKMVQDCGADMLRGGAWKPRTSTYDFQGLEEKGLEYLALAKETTGLPIVTEIMGAELIPLFEQYGIDVYQVGARNCQNFHLLKALSLISNPIVHKKGVDVDEYMNAAEYLYAGNGLNSGNKNIILCERGKKTSETVTRNTIDVGAIAYIRKKSHLPIIGDPSHSAGNSEYVPEMSYAIVGAGAHGLIIEAHINPEKALCDGGQSVNKEQLRGIIKKCRIIYDAVHQ